MYLIAKASYAGRAIGQYVGWLNWEACLVDAHATAALACIDDDVAHAALQALRFAVGHTLAIAALAALLANGAIGHGWRFGAFGMGAGAACLLLTGGVLSFATFHARWHKLAILTAGRVLVAAHGALIATQLAVLVAARVVILGAQQSCVALLIAFDA